MHEHIEPPDPHHHWYERHALMLTQEQLTGDDAIAAVHDVIARACTDPLVPRTDAVSEQQERDRRATSESFLHQADIALRHAVSTSITNALAR